MPIFKLKPILLNFGKSVFSVPSSKEVALKVAEQILGPIKDELDADGSLLDPILVESSEDVVTLESEMTRDADALLLVRVGGLPQALKILPNLGHLGKPMIMVGSSNNPWFATTLDVIADLRARGTEAYAPLDVAELNELVRILLARKALRRAKYLVFTSTAMPSLSAASSTLSPKYVEERFGARLEVVPTEELFEDLDNVSEESVEYLVRRLVREAEKIEVAEENIFKSARLYKALQNIMSRHEATGITINCGETVYMESNITPCLAFTLLKDEGIPAACEGDLTALLAMHLLMVISNKPALMGNLWLQDLDENLVRISHDVPSLKMEGFKEPLKPYVLHQFHKRGYGTTFYTDLKIGQQVTIARFSPKLDALLAITGEIAGCYDGVACRETIDVKVRDARELLHEAASFGPHFVVVYGNYIRQLHLLCKVIGIDLVASGSTHD